MGGAKRLYPTRKLYGVAENIAQFEPVIPRIEPLLAQLRDETRETVILGARQGLRVIYLAVFEGDQTIRYISRPGELKPMHASAVGKALLILIPQAERRRFVDKLPLDAITQRTIATPAALMEEVGLSERRGYSLTSGENVEDVMAVGRPLRIESADYAVAIAGPIGRVTPRIEAFAARLKALPEAVERLRGLPAPDADGVQ